jgi:hypothetical protein
MFIQKQKDFILVHELAVLEAFFGTEFLGIDMWDLRVALHERMKVRKRGRRFCLPFFLLRAICLIRVLRPGAHVRTTRHPVLTTFAELSVLLNEDPMVSILAMVRRELKKGRSNEQDPEMRRK